MIRPAAGSVSQGFHAGHLAIDIANTKGTPVYAPEAGPVTYVGQMGSGTNNAGNVVQIGDTQNGHRLCHLDSMAVRSGQRVEAGQLVGRMGNTGYVIGLNGGDGTHLHWVCWRNGSRVNGLNYITQNEPGEPPMTRDEEANAYQIVLGRPMEHGGSGRTGYKFIVDAQGEIQSRISSLNRQIDEQINTINDLRQALTEARNIEAAEDVVEAQKTQALKDAQAELERLKSQPPKQVEVIREVFITPPPFPPLTVETTAETSQPEAPKPSWITRLILLLLKRKKG